MRRAEMARRRKNLSEKRNEEEKVILPPLQLVTLRLSLLLNICLTLTHYFPFPFLPSHKPGVIT